MCNVFDEFIPLCLTSLLLGEGLNVDRALDVAARKQAAAEIDVMFILTADTAESRKEMQRL